MHDSPLLRGRVNYVPKQDEPMMRNSLAAGEAAGLLFLVASTPTAAADSSKTKPIDGFLDTPIIPRSRSNP